MLLKFNRMIEVEKYLVRWYQRLIAENNKINSTIGRDYWLMCGSIYPELNSTTT